MACLVTTAAAAYDLQHAYGPLFDIHQDAAAPQGSLQEFARTIRPGTKDAICVLKPTRDYAIDRKGAGWRGAEPPRQRVDRRPHADEPNTGLGQREGFLHRCKTNRVVITNAFKPRFVVVLF